MPSERRNRSQLVRSAAVPARQYRALLTDIKERIRLAQIKASLSVNRELIQLYWDIGGLIVSRQRAESWGSSIVEKLASDIRKGFPGIEGFSPRNVWRMRAFYLAWVPSEPMPIAVQKENRKELPRAVADLDRRSPPQPVAEIPWGHNVILLICNNLSSSNVFDGFISASRSSTTEQRPEQQHLSTVDHSDIRGSRPEPCHHNRDSSGAASD